jgi:Ca2+-binding RTX toxin-like protein
VDTYNFAGFTNLLGGSAVDTFRAAQGITFLGQINGGMGSDRLDYAAFTSAVVANLATGQVTGFGSAIGIENATGGSGDDLLVGNNDSNLLSGGNGDDILFGLGGNDSLSGNTGRDILFGGTGSDIIHGNNTDDILVGGSTVFADELSGTVNQLALQAIRNEWKRLDTTYSLRIAHLDGTSSGGGEQFLLP